jgi:hypothetical protein
LRGDPRGVLRPLRRTRGSRSDLPDNTPDLPNFAETFARQSSWEWNFGQAPAFSHLLDERFTWGVELHFDVEKGHITRTQVFTDSLNPAPLEALAARLQGCPYRADVLQQECDALIVDFPEQEKSCGSCRRGLPARCADKKAGCGYAWPTDGSKQCGLATDDCPEHENRYPAYRLGQAR